MSRHLPLAAALLAASLCAQPAAAYIATNGLLVEPVGNTEFNVRFMGLSGAPQFWCAAGDYVVNWLDLPRTTRIYRVSPPPRKAGQGIVFTLDPAKAGPSSGLLVYGSPDESISASLAQTFCESRWPFGWGMFN